MHFVVHSVFFADSKHMGFYFCLFVFVVVFLVLKCPDDPDITTLVDWVTYLPLKWLQRCLVVTWLVPRDIAAISVEVLPTPCNHASV